MKEKKETMKEKNKKQKVVLQLCFDQEEIIIIIKKNKKSGKDMEAHQRRGVRCQERGVVVVEVCREEKPRQIRK